MSRRTPLPFGDEFFNEDTGMSYGIDEDPEREYFRHRRLDDIDIPDDDEEWDDDELDDDDDLDDFDDFDDEDEWDDQTGAVGL